MDINDRLYVELHPLESGTIPRPHPIEDAGFDPQFIYKVLGMYNPSETSECYFVLANPQRQIWFISQRHLRAFALLDCDEFFLTPEQAQQLGCSTRTSNSIPNVESRRPHNGADRWASHEPALPDQPSRLDPTHPWLTAPPPGRNSR
jgi:hypothetical protein